MSAEQAPADTLQYMATAPNCGACHQEAIVQKKTADGGMGCVSTMLATYCETKTTTGSVVMKKPTTGTEAAIKDIEMKALTATTISSA